MRQDSGGGFRLRAYQVRALEALHEAIQHQDIMLLQAATGAGKTVIVARLINRYFHDHPDRSFLILMHKQELVEQFASSFRRFSSIPMTEIGLACAGLGQVDTDKRLVIASVQTLARRLDVYGGADLVVVDEAHHIGHDQESQYRTILDTLRTYRPRHKVIGVTATAYRLGHGMIYGGRCRPGRQNFFPELTCRITYKELVQDGHLMPLKGYAACTEGAAGDLAGVDLSGGEYNIGQAGRVMSRHVESAVDAYEQYGAGHLHVAVFACTIEHCEKLRQAFEARGYAACVVHSKLTKAEREANLKGWREGRYNFAISVNILVEGFDFPQLSCLIMCRPTKSPVVFIQAVGRILRTAPGKEEALLIDLTTNVNEFGLDLDRPRFTIPASRDGEGGEPPEKVCPGKLENGEACGQMLHAAVLVCPRCGHQWDQHEVARELGVLDEVQFKSEPDPPQWYAVTSMDAGTHEARSGKRLFRIRLRTGGYYGREVSVWICMPDHYSGYAVEKGQEKWEMFSDEPFPDTVEEAEFLAGTLRQPLEVLCRETSDGYLDAVEFRFDEDGMAADDEKHEYTAWLERANLAHADMADGHDSDEVPF